MLSAHIFTKVLQYGIESLDYTINGDTDQLLVLTSRVTQLIRQTGESLVEYLRIDLVQWRSLVGENGSEAVAQVLTALLELMDMVELEREVRLRIRHQVLAYQIDTRLHDHKTSKSHQKEAGGIMAGCRAVPKGKRVERPRSGHKSQPRRSHDRYREKARRRRPLLQRQF